MPQGRSLVRKTITLPPAVRRQLGIVQASPGPTPTPAQAVKAARRAVVGADQPGASLPGAVASPGGVNARGKRCKYGVRADGYCADRPVVPDTVIHLVRYDPRYPPTGSNYVGGASPPGGSLVNAVVTGGAAGAAGTLTAAKVAKSLAKKAGKALSAELTGTGGTLTAGQLSQIEARAARNQKFLVGAAKAARKLLTRGR